MNASLNLPMPSDGLRATGGEPVDAAAFTPAQAELVARPFEGSIFLEGPAGSGKTTAAVERANRLVQQSAASDRLLVLVPQRSLANPYLAMIERSPGLNFGRMTVTTLGGLARRTAELFWPLFAEQAGFHDPAALPTFLTLETAAYVLAQTVDPLIEQGAFEGLAIERSQLYRQILDNLNKAALVGFPPGEIGARLHEAWVGKADQARMYADAQRCASAFRDRCLQENLLDFSLQVEVFFEHILNTETFRTYRTGIATHLIAENIEEDAPRAHDLLRAWLPEMETALLVYDQQAGFRRFLGADPVDAYELKSRCDVELHFGPNLVSSDAVDALGSSLAAYFQADPGAPAERALPALHVEVQRTLPDSIAWIAEQVRSLLAQDGVQAADIAIVAPYLSDTMRFLLGRSLEQRGIPWIAFRPSRPIRLEPAARSLLTLAALAHPEWDYVPISESVARTLAACIAELDPVRADLLARVLYNPRAARFRLGPFSQLRGEMQDRLTFTLGQRYDMLRQWLLDYVDGPRLALDIFLRKLFGEVLTQPGFGFEDDLTGGSVISTLIGSIQKFRWILGDRLVLSGLEPGPVYLKLVDQGVVSAQELRRSETGQDPAVSILPAFTFLMTNRPVAYQFWLDAGSQGWAERIYQPLTHPYVLNRQWPSGAQWTDEHEMRVRDEIAATICLGLTRRCRRAVFAVWNEYGERGYEQRGPLLKALQAMLRSGGAADGA